VFVPGVVGERHSNPKCAKVDGFRQIWDGTSYDHAQSMHRGLCHVGQGGIFSGEIFPKAAHTKLRAFADTPLPAAPPQLPVMALSRILHLRFIEGVLVWLLQHQCHWYF
jgi:hypothetical protein